MPSITYECEDCGHQEGRNLRKVHGETPDDDEFKVVGGEMEVCPSCGSKEIREYTNGVCLRDEGREDFHADG